MKLFKILMSALIAAMAAVILCSTFSGCHTLKKSSRKIAAYSDSAVFSKHASAYELRYDSAKGVLVWDSSAIASKKDYTRETVVEEFEIQCALPDPKDYEQQPWYTGDTARRIWQDGHGLLKKRTTIKESGTAAYAETMWHTGKDTAHVSRSAEHQVSSQDSSRVVKEDHTATKDKEAKTAFRGWVIMIIGVVLIIALLYWLYKKTPFIPLFKSDTDADR